MSTIPSGSRSTATLLRAHEPPAERRARRAPQARLLTMLAWGLGSGTRRARVARRLLRSALAGATPCATSSLELLDAVDERSRTRQRTVAAARARSPSRCTRATPAGGRRRARIRRRRQAEGHSGRDPVGAAGAERRLLHRPPQGRARLLADDDVPRLRDQPRAVPLGIPVAPDTATANRPALHQPRSQRHA